MNRMNLLYTLDGLLKNCKVCSHSAEQGTPEIRCNGCSFYPQIRWIGEQLGRKEQVGKIEMTVDEYVDLKFVKKLPITKIAELKGVKDPTIHHWKNKRAAQIEKALNRLDETEKVELPKNDAKTEELQYNCDLKEKKIEQLREQVNQRDLSIEKLHAEILNLRDENSGLAEERVKNDRVIENQKYQLSKYAEELVQLQEEIGALKVFAKRYLEV